MLPDCFTLSASPARVVELADTGDLKSPGRLRPCGFESRPGYRPRWFAKPRQTRSHHSPNGAAAAENHLGICATVKPLATRPTHGGYHGVFAF